MFHDLLLWVENLSLSVTIAESGWMFPTLESVHVVGLATVIGTISIVDLRLLGWASTGRPVTAVTRDTLPYTWAGFALAATAGLLMFMSKAVSYAANVPFRIKVVLLALAGLNMLAFHLLSYKRVGEWDRDRVPPNAARLAGGLSLLLWTLIVFFGRWIAFVE